MTLFAFHPLQVESVAWVSEQRGLLATALAFTAMAMMLDFAKKPGHQKASARWPAGATVCFIMALLAKPSVATVPLLMLAMTAETSPVGRTIIRWVMLWCVLSMVCLAVTRVVQPATLNSFETPLILRPVVAGDALAFYASKLFWPVDLCFNYGWSPARALADPFTFLRAALAVVLMAAVFGIASLRIMRQPLIISLVALAPVLGFTPFLYQNQSTIADRYGYIAMLGPTVGVARVVDSYCKSPLRRRVATAAAFCIAAVLGAVSFHQSMSWKNAGTVASHACEVAPWAEAAWVLQSGFSLIEGRHHEAAASAKRALEISPRHSIAMLNLLASSARLEDKKTQSWVLRQLEAVRFPPQERAEVFFERGCQLLKNAKPEEAVVDFALAVAAEPSHRGALNNMGATLTRLGHYAQAIDVLKDAVSRYPRDVSSLVSLGNALLLAHRPLEAVAAYDSALEITPDDRDILLNRSQAHMEAGSPDAAEEDLLRARQLPSGALR
jgi:tetratricopeptide (TPR) repeat protein